MLVHVDDFIHDPKPRSSQGSPDNTAATNRCFSAKEYETSHYKSKKLDLKMLITIKRKKKNCFHIHSKKILSFLYLLQQNRLISK